MQGNKRTEENIYEFINEHINDYDRLSLRHKSDIIGRLIKGCKNCRVRYETGLAPVPSLVNPNSLAVFVGRSPSRIEATTGELFPAKSSIGNIFDSYLNVLGLSREDISILNMVNCHTKGNAPPQRDCINRCKAFKYFEFEAIASYRILFLLGNDACEWVLGDNSLGVLSLLGDVCAARIGGNRVIIVPMLHPAHLMVDSEYKDSVYKVLLHVSNIVKQLKNQISTAN